MIRKFGHALGRIRRTSAAIVSAGSGGCACAKSTANAAGERENPGVTVNEKMRVISGACQNVSSKAQQLTNMLRFGRAHARFLVDNIVKAQFQPLFLDKRTELWRRGQAWIEERKHMAGADTSLPRELREAADCNSERE